MATETDHERRERKRDAAAREMTRLRTADRDEEERAERDLADVVGEERRRERETQEDDGEG